MRVFTYCFLIIAVFSVAYSLSSFCFPYFALAAWPSAMPFALLFRFLCRYVRGRKYGESKDIKAYPGTLRSEYDFEQHFVYERSTVGSRQKRNRSILITGLALCRRETFASSLIKGRRERWVENWLGLRERRSLCRCLVSYRAREISPAKARFRFYPTRSNVASIYIVDYITSVKPLN